MNNLSQLSAICAFSFTFISLAADASLTGISPATSGGTDWQAVDDDDLEASWLANAALAETMDFGVSGINTNGSMSAESI